MSIPFDPPRPRPAGGGGGGAAGFTPVLFTAQWNADRVVQGGKAIEPDTIISEDGITSGNGTDNTPYGWSYDTPNSPAGKTFWKVSEEMAGVYTLTITWTAQRRYPNPSSEMIGPIIEVREESGTTNKIMGFKYEDAFDTTADKRMAMSATVTLRMNAEDRMRLDWGGTVFHLMGGSVNSPSGWISMVKVSN